MHKTCRYCKKSMKVKVITKRTKKTKIIFPFHTRGRFKIICEGSDVKKVIKLPKRLTLKILKS